MAGGVVTGSDRLLVKIVNLYRLHEYVDYTIEGLAKSAGPFSFSPELICHLHSIAMDRLLASPGAFRKCAVAINGCPHVPPHWVEVETQVKSLCDYVNAMWNERDLVHLAAFVLWRLNWIHPFENGNGRTSRASCYLVLCAKFGQLLPAKQSIVEQITKNRSDYYAALRKADTVYADTQNIDLCLHDLTLLLERMLMLQLKASL